MSGIKQTHSGSIKRVTVWGMIINLGLAGLKFVMGILGHSQALIADAAHSLSDMVTDVAVIVGVRFWSEPADEEHPYGHGRLEMLVSLFIALMLAGVGIGICYNAVITLHKGESHIPGMLALVAAVVSVVVKEWLYRWTVKAGKAIKSSAVIANAWHHRSDAISSIPVVLAVVGIRINPEWQYLDHIAAVVVSVLIVKAAKEIAMPQIRHLMDAGATQEELKIIKEIIYQTEGVITTHKVRTRHIGSGLQVDLHVQVAPELTVGQGHDVAKRVEGELLENGPDIVDVLVHIEPYTPE